MWLKEKVIKPEARIALRSAAPKIRYESKEQILNHLIRIRMIKMNMRIKIILRMIKDKGNNQ